MRLPVYIHTYLEPKGLQFLYPSQASLENLMGLPIVWSNSPNNPILLSEPVKENQTGNLRYGTDQSHPREACWVVQANRTWNDVKIVIFDFYVKNVSLLAIFLALEQMKVPIQKENMEDFWIDVNVEQDSEAMLALLVSQSLPTITQFWVTSHPSQPNVSQKSDEAHKRLSESFANLPAAALEIAKSGALLAGSLPSILEVPISAVSSAPVLENLASVTPSIPVLENPVPVIAAVSTSTTERQEAIIPLPTSSPSNEGKTEIPSPSDLPVFNNARPIASSGYIVDQPKAAVAALSIPPVSNPLLTAPGDSESQVISIIPAIPASSPNQEEQMLPLIFSDSPLYSLKHKNIEWLDEEKNMQPLIFSTPLRPKTAVQESFHEPEAMQPLIFSTPLQPNPDVQNPLDAPEAMQAIIFVDSKTQTGWRSTFKGVLFFLMLIGAISGAIWIAELLRPGQPTKLPPRYEDHPLSSSPLPSTYTPEPPISVPTMRPDGHAATHEGIQDQIAAYQSEAQAYLKQCLEQSQLMENAIAAMKKEEQTMNELVNKQMLPITSLVVLNWLKDLGNKKLDNEKNAFILLSPPTVPSSEENPTQQTCKIWKRQGDTIGGWIEEQIISKKTIVLAENKTGSSTIESTYTREWYGQIQQAEDLASQYETLCQMLEHPKYKDFLVQETQHNTEWQRLYNNCQRWRQHQAGKIKYDNPLANTQGIQKIEGKPETTHFQLTLTKNELYTSTVIFQRSLVYSYPYVLLFWEQKDDPEQERWRLMRSDSNIETRTLKKTFWDGCFCTIILENKR